jgi:hypothetical protein
VLLVSCQEEIFLDLKTVVPTPAIEAIWTNNGNMNQVKIMFSKDYYNQELNEIVTDAEVALQT